MIFSQYRDSVQEIVKILSQHSPLVNAMPFIGQASDGKSTKGYTQKQQLKVRVVYVYNNSITTQHFVNIVAEYVFIVLARHILKSGHNYIEVKLYSINNSNVCILLVTNF